MVKCTNCGIQIEGKFKFCPSCGVQIVDAPNAESSLIGKTLKDKYRILSEIGAGSMGTVYLAEHIGLKKRMAIKILRPDLQVSEESLKRFQREGIAAGQFTHPNAIQIFDFDRTDDRTFFLAMEYVNGFTLGSLIAREGRVSPKMAVAIIKQVLSVLDEAHGNGIVHRDLKPENIMIVKKDTGKHAVKVLDFGLSKLVDVPTQDSVVTQVGQILGSPRYMAPEQCSGDVIDHRIDIYATGLILFEMLSGTPPSQGNSVTEILLKRTSEPAPVFSEEHPDLDIPADLEEIMHKALKRLPDERFQTAAEMMDALDEVDFDRVGHAGIRRSASSKRRARTAREKAKREGKPRSGGQGISPKALAVGLAVIVVAAIAVWWALTGGFGAGSKIEPPRVSMKSPEDRTEMENQYVSHLDGANSALRDLDFDGAMSSVDDAIRLACKDEEAYLVRGRIYMKRGDLDMARADFEEALKMQADYAEAAVGLGWILFEKKDYTGALAQFEKAVGMDPNCAEALAGQGATYYARGDRTDAKVLLTGAIELKPSLPKAYCYLGRIRLDEKAVDEAIQAFIQAKRNDGHLAAACIGLGKAYQLRGDFDPAEREFEEALNLDPQTIEARNLLVAILIEKGDYEKAEPVMEAALRGDAENGRLRILLGILREAKGQTDEAIEALKEGVAVEADLKAVVLLGILLEKREKFEEALSYFQAAVEMDSSKALPFLHKGLALIALERYEEAGEAFAGAIDLDPENAFARYNLGVVQMDYLDQPDQAIEQFTRYEALGGMDTERNRKVRGWLAAKGL